MLSDWCNGCSHERRIFLSRERHKKNPDPTETKAVVDLLSGLLCLPGARTGKVGSWAALDFAGLLNSVFQAGHSP